MKKILALLLVLAVSGSATLFAQDSGSESKPFSVDAAGGVSFGLFGNLGTIGGVDMSLVASILSLRAGIDGDVLYRLNDTVAVGPQLGLYALQYTVTSGNTENTVTFIDIPVRVIARVGGNGAFIQPFVGYYAAVNTLTNFAFPPAGLEVGARGALGNFFIEGGYVLGSSTWTHITLGFQATDLFKF